MKLRQFLELEGKTLKQFCEENGLNYGTMRVMLCRHDSFSPQKALLIEKATNGRVHRMELLYPEERKSSQK